MWYWLVATIWPAWLTPDADIDRLPLLARVAGVATLAWAAAWAAQTRSPQVRLCLGWCVLALLPRLVVQTPRSYLNAHQVSVAFMGVVLLVAYGAERWRARCVA